MIENKNWITVDTIAKNFNRIEIGFSVSSGLSGLFVKNRMVIDFSVDISQSDQSFLVIPFVCNVLPIIWLTDSVLYVDEMDYDFYHCIENVKNGYREIYPNLSFLGDIRVNHIKKSDLYEEYDKSVCLFSGGVDATATLLRHYNENPGLVFIHGADIPLADRVSGQSMLNHVKSISDTLSLNCYSITSNFREFIDENALCDYLSRLQCPDDWWHGFQHGIGLIGHLAPICHTEGIGKIYIASSYTIRERGITTCASDPRIDNHLCWTGTTVFHDGFELSRQQKIEYIVKSKLDYGAKVVSPLHVCWEDKSDKNCGKCEKCYRTYFGFLAEGAHPEDYGLRLMGGGIRVIIRLLVTIHISNNVMPLWKDIQNRVWQRYNFWTAPFLLKFIYIININYLGKAPAKRLKRWLRMKI